MPRVWTATANPEQADPRTDLSQGELATVNAEADQLATRLSGWSRAAASRHLADGDGTEITSAVMRVFEELQTAPGQVVPIETFEDVHRK